jgi:SET domain-containing protein
MVNHSGVHPNLHTVCRRIGYRVHLLLVATTDVNPNEEFFFDYGVRSEDEGSRTYIVAAPNLAPDTLKFVAFGMAWPNLVVKTKSSEKIVYYPRPHF